MANLIRINDAASLGLHAMAYLAGNGASSPVPVNRMAEKLGVSAAHLGKVLQRLVRVGLIRSKRGPGGGFQLRRPPEEVTLLEVFEAIQGPMSSAGCLLGHDTCHLGSCILGGLVGEVQQLVRHRLEETRLSDFSLPLAPRGGSEEKSP